MIGFKSAAQLGRRFFLRLGSRFETTKERASRMASNHQYDLSWQDVERLCEELSTRLKAKALSAGEWQGIVAVARGGLIPSAMIASQMDIRRIEALSIASYDDAVQRQELTILNAPAAAMSVDGHGWLVIDDLVDSGDTARAARRLLPNGHIATLIAKPKGRPFVDSYVTDKAQEEWINFPWEVSGVD